MEAVREESLAGLVQQSWESCCCPFPKGENGIDRLAAGALALPERDTARGVGSRD
jgi:hypothetical protein